VPTAGSARIDCQASTAGKDALGVSVVSGLRALQEAGVLFQVSQLVSLPSSLGLAKAQGDPPDWRVYALFRCGQNPYWLWLRVNPVATGRDALADLTVLARIAERRWARMNNCTLDPAHPPKPAP
jgi:hypothetical protein